MNSAKRIEEESREKSDKLVFDEKKRRREEYSRVKAEVKKLEDNNFSHLIMFGSGKDWYKMGGNSLYIYYYEIAKKILGLKPNIQPDTDYSSTIFEEGLISFRGVEPLQKKLEKAKVLSDKQVGKNVVMFRLNFSVTKGDIDRFREDFRFERERALTILRPNVVLYPKVYEHIRRVQKRVFEVVRKMSVFERDYNGLLMAEYSRKIAKYYMLLNSRTLSEKDGWKKIYELTNLLIIEISFAAELKEWRQDVAVSIGAELIEIKREAEKRLAEGGKSGSA